MYRSISWESVRGKNKKNTRENAQVEGNDMPIFNNNAMADDSLATIGARASAAMVLV